MCVSMTPGVPVHFSETIVYAAEVETPGAGWVHVLGYQNAVQNHVGAPEPGGFKGWWQRLRGRQGVEEGVAGGNAMLLPFPAKPGTMTAANAIDMERCPGALEDMRAALVPPAPRSLGAVGFGAQALSAQAVQVFEVSGVYTVVLAQDARAIPGALERVPEARRPALNPALMEAYAAWYPGWTLALCCFEARRLTRATPLVWWYTPADPTRLFMPGLDCHTGDVPDLSADVGVDHALVLGSSRMVQGVGRPVMWTDPLPTQRVDGLGVTADALLCGQVVGEFGVSGVLRNGDWWGAVEDVRAGRATLERVGPPGVTGGGGAPGGGGRGAWWA